MTDPNDLNILQDGTHADPADCSPHKDGVYRHKDGLAVQMREDGETPQTVGQAAIDNHNVTAAEAGKPEPPPEPPPEQATAKATAKAPEPAPAVPAHQPAQPEAATHRGPAAKDHT